VGAAFNGRFAPGHSTPAAGSASPHRVAGAPRQAPLALGRGAFRRAGHRLVEDVSGYLEALTDRPVTVAERPASLRALLDAGAPLPATGMDAEALLREATATLFDHSLANGHPMFFGYVTSSPAPIGMLGDLLAAALNANVGAWRLAPSATEIEAQTVRWIAELVGYPTDCGGLFTSGGNMANIVALVAARSAAAGREVRRLGLGGAEARPMRVYASTETHAWLHKAATVSGIGPESLAWITVDEASRMDVAALRRAIAADRAAGVIPMTIVATAGTVGTGAVDPIVELAELCREEGVWLHVDGAYGAFAAAVPGAPADLRALRLADSVAVDPHKWLYAPIEAGCLLVRDAEALRRTFCHQPAYYEFGDEAVNYHEHGPQNTRGFRALKVWLALRQIGRAGYEQSIGDDLRLSRRLYRSLGEHPEIETLTHHLSICTFRYLPPDLKDSRDEPGTRRYLDELNRRLVETLQASGEVFLSNALVRGVYALRTCIVNFNTEEEHVDAVPGVVVRFGRELDRARRSPHRLTGVHGAAVTGRPAERTLP